MNPGDDAKLDAELLNLAVFGVSIPNDDPFDGRDVLLRFTPIAPHPEEMNPDCPDEFAIVRLEDYDPAGMMVWQRRGDKWEKNAHWCYRHVVRWFMAERNAMRSILARIASKCNRCRGHGAIGGIVTETAGTTTSKLVTCPDCQDI